MCSVDGKPAERGVAQAARRPAAAAGTGAHRREPAFRPQPMALDIVFEDEHLLVLDKPAGLVVHPAPGNWSGTLLNGLLAHHAAAAHAAARRHRAPAGQGHLRPDGGGQDPAGGDRAGRAPSPRARCSATTWRWPTAACAWDEQTRRCADRPRPGVARAHGGGGRGQAGAHRRATAWPRRDGCQRAGAARCTPAAPTRSACTWPGWATRWWPTRCTAARRRWACSARRCMPRGWACASGRRRAAGLRLRRRRPTLPRPGHRSRTAEAGSARRGGATMRRNWRCACTRSIRSRAASTADAVRRQGAGLSTVE